MVHTKQNNIVSALKLLNKTAYNELIILQGDMVWFNIIEEAKKKVISIERQDKCGWKFQENLS